MVAPVNHEVIELDKVIRIFLFKGILPSNLLYFPICRYIFTVKVLIYDIELSDPVSRRIWHDFSESEIKRTNLPLLVASEKILRVFLWHTQHGDPFLTIPRDREIGKFFQELLLFLILRLLFGPTIPIHLHSTVDSSRDFIKSFYLVIFSEPDYLVRRNYVDFILLRLF